MQFWALIVDCFRESIDRKLFWIMAVISLVIAAAMACIGFDDTGINLFFGMKHFDAPRYVAGNDVGASLVGALLTKLIGDLYIGWVGIIVALIATGSIFPDMMRRGAIDLMVSKPLSRPMLFLGKYIGGMVFVTLQTVIFVALTFLVVGLRWGYWLPGYLWSIPLMVVLFSYLYGFSVLFAVLTRSTATALLLTMVAWIVIWAPQEARSMFVSLPAITGEETVNEKWVGRFTTICRFIPKTQDIPLIAGNLMGASTTSELFDDASNPELEEESRHTVQAGITAEKRLADLSIARSIGSSLLFEAMLVVIAMWKFTRLDF